MSNSAKITGMKPVDKYRDWDIYEQMQDGWQLFPYVGSPLFGTVFISNGKNILNGRKQALLRIDVRQPERQEPSTEAKPVEAPKPTEPDPLRTELDIMRVKYDAIRNELIRCEGREVGREMARNLAKNRKVK